MSYIIRFYNNIKFRDPVQRLHGNLTTLELQQGTDKWVQINAFKDEITSLKAKVPLSKKAKIISLTPFLDENEILRVGGRLHNSECEYNTKHPVILPKKHIITNYIIIELHKKHLHAGITLLTSIIRQNYWIIGCRNIIRHHIHKCLPCFRQKTTISRQLMGNLPHHRVQGSRPFLRVGVDYAGPVSLRALKGRGHVIHKGYIAVFVCLGTKAFHLELVSDLTSNAFLAALRRFTARRGIAADIYSDNATNFVGVERLLRELLTSSNYNETISRFLTTNGTNWHFTPPASPNFGGLWEAGVKSVKFHIVRVIGNSIITFEEMATLLTGIEALLNSRPLCPKSLNDTDYEPLTPAHFLIGQPLTVIPEPDLKNIPIPHLSRWQLIQKMMQGFWQRWSQDYLHELNQRTKWRQPTNNFQVGELVIVREDNLPPTQWVLGRITHIHPGNDDLFRVVTIKTNKGQYKRSISKIVRLPIET